MCNIYVPDKIIIEIEEFPTSAGLATFSIVGSARKAIFSFPYFLHVYLTVVGVGHSPQEKSR
jgi:hypothetical protein